jgi:hypothetical protein
MPQLDPIIEQLSKATTPISLTKEEANALSEFFTTSQLRIDELKAQSQTDRLLRNRLDDHFLMALGDLLAEHNALPDCPFKFEIVSVRVIHPGS